MTREPTGPDWLLEYERPERPVPWWRRRRTLLIVGALLLANVAYGMFYLYGALYA